MEMNDRSPIQLWSQRSKSWMQLNKPIYLNGIRQNFLEGNVLKIFEMGYHEGFQKGYKISGKGNLAKAAPHVNFQFCRTDNTDEIFDKGVTIGYEDAVSGMHYRL